jgi:penicillin-binding protein 2A
MLKIKWNAALLWRFIIIILFISIVVIVAAASWYIKNLDIAKLEHPLPQPTYIYDRNGQLASQVSSSQIVPVSLHDVPEHVRNAMIAVEDRRFYKHAGVDIWAIMRSLFKDVMAGEIVQGGSTITQQLAKNMFLSSERTLSRKLKEAAIAIKIDFVYSKDQILEMYLNQIYMGEGSWGVQDAANVYFGKKVEQLSLSESALLAALPKAPSRYSPFQNKEKALERRNLVLALMLEQNYIERGAYEEAVLQPVVLAEGNQEELRGKYSSYVDFVIEEAVSVYGFTEEQILSGGLHIYTTLEPAVQQAMEDVYEDERYFPRSKEDQIIQSGAVVLDPYTGGIRGLIGHRGNHVFRGFNRATQLKRQPGSSFKPIIVYAPAMEQGYSPYSKLYDGELDIGGYRPQDWDRRTRGEVTLYEAVVKSWNIPAVWLLNEIGLRAGIDFVAKLGIPLTEHDSNLGIALGGLSDGVSPLQMAQAFGAFPNLGVVNPAHAISRITTSNEHVLIEAKPSPTKVMTPATAYTMTLILQDAVRLGTGKLAATDRPTAGKTGTTQLPETKQFAGLSGVKDAWFVGYTPELTAAVWTGYDTTDRDHFLDTSGGNPSAIVFREILSRALKDVPVSGFKKPRGFKLSPPPNDEERSDREAPSEKKSKKKRGKKKENDDN